MASRYEELSAPRAGRAVRQQAGAGTGGVHPNARQVARRETPAVASSAPKERSGLSAEPKSELCWQMVLVVLCAAAVLTLVAASSGMMGAVLVAVMLATASTVAMVRS